MKKIWFKYKEYILYILFGGLTTLVGWGTFYICVHPLGMNVVPGNVISWILAVAVSYVTNRLWVFESKAYGFRNIIREIGGFTASRLLTLGIETVLLWLTVDILGCNDMLMKVIISILVIILNYVFSKFFVFRSEKKNGEDQ